MQKMRFLFTFCIFCDIITVQMWMIIIKMTYQIRRQDKKIGSHSELWLPLPLFSAPLGIPRPRCLTRIRFSPPHGKVI